MVDWKEAREYLKELMAEQEIAEAGERIDLSPTQLIQLFSKIIQPEKKYNVITKDLKTSNLDKEMFKRIIFAKSIAKDFSIFQESFELEDDKWIKAVFDSIDADAEIICSASQGLLAKLLETIITLRRTEERRIAFEKEKRGLIFK